MSDYTDHNQVIANLDQAESWLVEFATKYKNETKIVTDDMLQRLGDQLNKCDCKSCQFAYMVTWYGIAKLREQVDEPKQSIDDLNEMFGVEQ